MAWSITDYKATPSANAQINGINIAEGCPPSGINDAIRQMMADVKNSGAGERIPAVDRYVHSAGTVQSRGYGDLTVEKTGTGEYKLTSSALTGNHRIQITPYAGSGAYYFTKVSTTTNNSLTVTTFNAAGSAADLGFFISITTN